MQTSIHAKSYTAALAVNEFYAAESEAAKEQAEEEALDLLENEWYDDAPMTPWSDWNDFYEDCDAYF